jgi:LytS/YehU family sensor histidine kinase
MGSGDQLVIRISNTGKLNSQKPLTGVGFKNSVQRLNLLYGQAGSIRINENDNWVVVEIAVPLRK